MESRVGAHRSTPLADLSIQEVLSRLSTGRLSHARYFEDVLARCEQAKFAGAFTQRVEPEVQQAAAAARDSIKMRARAKLFGVPFIVKDSVDVAGVATSCWCVVKRATPC